MTTENTDSNDLQPATQRVLVSAGESVRVVREMQELSRPELANISGIALNVLKAIERKQIALSAEYAAILARSLRVHPAVLLKTYVSDDSESAA